MKVYLFIMSLWNPSTDMYDGYLLDYNLSAQDCIEMLNDFAVPHNPNVSFTCVAQADE